MRARVLSWTKVERPPAGFPAGRVIALVEVADGGAHYAVWERAEPPALDAEVMLAGGPGAWTAR